MDKHSLQIAKIDEGCRLLAEAKSIPEVKEIRDRAEAVRLYLRQRDGSFDAQQYAAELKLRAERKLGDLLDKTVKNCRPKKVSHDAIVNGRLPEGVSLSQSSRWQREAKVDDDQFENFVVACKEEGVELTTAGLLRVQKESERETKREKNRELVKKSPAPAKDQAYPTIVIDPPWDWGDEGDCDQLGRATPTYATMPIEQVANLPVGSLGEKNCHLYLWITNRSLPKGFALLERWGFRYVTCLTWCKPSFGMGNYFRGSTEQILFAVRGSLSLLRHDVGTWFAAPRPGKHSSKPDEFYSLVESCSPGPWLEMFARKARKGWGAWGAEL